MENREMSRHRTFLVAIVTVCVLSLAGAATSVVSAQQGKVVSIYGSRNQDVTIDQMKAARVTLKAERADQHMEWLKSREALVRPVFAWVNDARSVCVSILRETDHRNESFYDRPWR
jgi:hypothetical protein